MVCDFLTDQFEVENKAYSTVNSYRSALSSILPPVDGTLLGEHPIIARLLKGMFLIRPPQPKYTVTWDVNILLKFLESWEPLNTLTLKQLTLKTVALLALVSAQRSQTLAALRVDFMSKTQDTIQFVVQDILKTSRPGKSPLVLLLPAFPDNRHLCVYLAVSQYIARTQPTRQSLNTQKLFLSYGQPFKVVCASTIARWLKMALALAGIDTAVFKGHSFRSASTSKADPLGVSLDIILKTADWKRAGTFCKFYKKDVSNDAVYAQTLLSTSV